MLYYVFNDNKPLKEASLRIVHHCDKCNTDLVGEWNINVFKDLYFGGPKVIKRAKPIAAQIEKEAKEFAGRKQCLLCGKKFSEIPEYHAFSPEYGYSGDCFMWYYQNAMLEYILLGDLLLKYSLHYFPIHERIAESSLLKYNEAIPRPGEEVLTETGVGILSEPTKTYNGSPAWWVSYCDNTPESLLAFMERFFHKRKREQAQKQLAEFENKYSFDSLENVEKRPQMDNAETLKEYLGYLLSIEKNIFSLSKRLEELYLAEIVAQADAVGAKCRYTLETEQKLLKAREQYRLLKAEKVEDCNIKYPKKPTPPKKPEEPILAKPGLFNKKRILAENALLTQKYQKALEDYTLSMEKYRLDLKKYNADVRLLKEQHQQEHQAKIEKADSSVAQFEEKLKADKESIKNLATPEKAKLLIVQEEIKAVEKLLKQFYEAKNRMYSCDVLFEKYRNFVAVASIYEYLHTGRCESLTGPHGAYNLYESEVLMNRVVDQLNKVIESLESIKTNQFIIYSAIQETNQQLRRLHSTTTQVLNELGAIKSTMTSMETYLGEIADNTAITAYNTAKTAFYSKKNAELTDAMGFLVALK